MYRTHTCGEIRKHDIGKSVTLAGWVNSRRDHGGVIFVDLRDRCGLTQVAFDPTRSQQAWQIADTVRSEYVIQVAGKVTARLEDRVNPNMATGEIEIDGEQTRILSEAITPPFELSKPDNTAHENLRLKYRFLDLRRPKMQKMLKTRDAMIRHIRNYFHEHDFVEVQTPILATSSPEGARDWLVPSRVYPGKFYALPQAPQQFKQLLMVGGVDRYFQIAPCFRDEDPRMDRHYGEFYQLDMEMSFVEQEDIFQIMEPLMIELTERFSNKQIIYRPFLRLPWRDAMERYGSDKPDLRFEMEIQPITHLVENSGFSVFDNAIKNGGVVHALKVGGANFSRKEIDELTEIAREHGAKGLAYILVEGHISAADAEFLRQIEENLRSPILKFMSTEAISSIVESVASCESGDIVFFGAGAWRVVCESLGAVRDECGKRLELKDSGKAAWCWITDFPMYKPSETQPGALEFAHNPFSMPQGGLEALTSEDPLDVLAYQFDFVCNGFELTSGAIRNHKPKIMYKAFEIAGYGREEVDRQFGHMIRAFEYGAPPHGGNAPGIDRLLMVLLDGDSIRDIYAFPKDGQGRDVMLGAPGEVDSQQLKALHIETTNN